jgi:hypothetical protein
MAIGSPNISLTGLVERKGRQVQESRRRRTAGACADPLAAQNDGVVLAGIDVIASAAGRLAAGALAAGVFKMSVSAIWPIAASHARKFGGRGAKALGVFPAVVLMLCASHWPR